MPINVKHGALVRLEQSGTQPQAIVFAYNPATVVTTLHNAGYPGAFAEAPARVEQLIRFTLELDATDALQFPQANPDAVKYGVNPALAALELLLRQDARVDPQAVTVLVWGPNRMLPVRLVGLEMVETLFDPDLNPVQADVHVTLRAWNAGDSGLPDPINGLILQRQRELQKLAQGAYGSVALPTS
jgi:hypothetical protein